MASRAFINDKLAYVFDSSAQNSSALASQVRLSVDTFQNVLKPILDGIDWNENRFGSAAQSRFQEQRMIEQIRLYSEVGNQPRLLDQMTVFPSEVKTLNLPVQTLSELMKTSASQGSALMEYQP